ncbi:MAG: response regulator [bacterium]|nr:response regulator [bacterium]
MRILVVDDDEITCDMLENILMEAGYRVDTASSGNEAWQMLGKHHYRMIISDWEMPNGDGIELCKKVRRSGSLGYTYFILLTHRNETADIVQGMASGADDFITKPFNPDEVRVRARAGERILALESRDVAIFAMAKLAESRNPETGAHLERIQAYAKTLAQNLEERGNHPDIDQLFVQMIFLTSPLHDIGKVGIPDMVLIKPGRLTDEEFEVMKDHTTIGANTLRAALEQYPEAEYLKMAYDIALTHHEKWDGSGYPQGLVGEKIPLSGRITALADVYDAVSSARVYKQKFSHNVTREIILQGDGLHFDPAVVQAFLDTEDEFIAIRNRLQATTETEEEVDQLLEV